MGAETIPSRRTEPEPEPKPATRNDANDANDANGGGSSAEKRARVERDAGGDARGGKRAAGQTPFSFAPRSRADAGARARGGGSRVERTTCFICQHVFPATALNTEINAHVDECMKTLA